MKANNYFTCIAYNNVDFLIHSKYVVSGVYVDFHGAQSKELRNIVFNRETLPHIYIGDLLERTFGCAPIESYTTVLVMNGRDFSVDVCKKIEDFTETALPASGNFALSVNSSISSSLVDFSSLRLVPPSIRTKQNDCGVSAIGFTKNDRKQFLIQADNLVRKFFTARLLELRRKA